MRALLLKNFDLKEEPAAKKTKKATGVKKETTPKSKAASKAPAKAKKKTPVKVKTETPAKPKARKKAPAKTKAKKAAAPKKAKVSIQELLFRQYGTGATNKAAAKSPHKKAVPVKPPEAPPFVVGQSEAETERIRALLFKVIDLKAEAEVEDVEKPAPDKEGVEAMPPVAPVTYSDSQPTSVAVKLGLSGLAILLAIIVAASFSNRNSFFLKNSKDAVEVWQGKFAPSGSELVLTLEGMKLPNPIRDVYTKSEVYRLVFDHLEGKADTLLYDPVGPDFSQINKYLRQAATYAPTQAERRMAQRRLDSISLLILFHKIDVALIKGTLPELEAAKASLEKGADYASSAYQRDLIAKRRAVLDSAISQTMTQ
jgi:hypothetical protein